MLRVFLLGMLFSVTNEILRSFRENVLVAMLLLSISGISAVRFSSLRSFAFFFFLRGFALVLRLLCARSVRRRVPTFSATPSFSGIARFVNEGRHYGFTLVSQFALDLSKNVSKPWWGRNLCYVGGCRGI